MLLAKIYWRRFRCDGCGRVFTLPLNDTTLPAHAARGRTESTDCHGQAALPA